MSPSLGRKLMISYETALARVLAELEQASVPVEVTHEGEFSDGWFFCYESKEFLASGELSAQLVGNCPILVDKYTEELVYLGTAQHPHDSVQDYLIMKRSEGTSSSG